MRDGRVQIDNNLVENTIRPSAIGKKNWLFMGDARSGARAATFYTLIGNCHREGINAEAYLTDIFTRLPGETNQTVHRLIPKAWAAEQAAQKPVKSKRHRNDHGNELGMGRVGSQGCPTLWTTNSRF